MRSNRGIRIKIAWATAAALIVTGGLASGQAAVRSSPAGLDFSFGSRGQVALGLGDQLHAVATQPDGKVVVVGAKRLRSGVRLLLARLSVNGRLDPSFNHGQVELGPTVPTGGSIGRAVAIQGDGKILVAGILTDRSGIEQGGMLAERFAASGAIDRSFGRGGVATVLAGTAQSAASALATARDGKIVLAGSGPGTDGLPRVALARLSSRGQPDRGFGSAGVVIAQGSADLGRDGAASALAVEPSGEIVVAGAVSPTLQVSNAIVAGFTSAGRLDRGFGQSGSFVVSGRVEGGAAALFRAVSLVPGGIIAAGAASSPGATPAFAIAARLSHSGQVVGSFGRGGIVALPSDRALLPPNVLPGANALANARGGVVVLAGAYGDSGRTTPALWALNARGSLISSGSTRTALSASLGSGATDGVAIDGRGRIVVVGTSNNFAAFNGFGLRYQGFGP